VSAAAQFKREQGVNSDLRTYAKEARAISFDVFDTLFVRPLRDPEDLFSIIADETGIIDFPEQRRAAQREAFRRMQMEGRNEITLAGIYECLPPEIGSATSLCRREYELELALTIPNPDLCDFFLELLNEKPVVIASDMYLPLSFFQELFKRNNLPAVPMFISSDRNCTKRDRGELFELVAHHLGLRPGDILHVGDNPASDIQQARSRGLRTFHYQCARKPTTVTDTGASASLSAGLIRIEKNASDVTPFYELGYRYGGPTATAFLHWTEKQVLADSIDLVLFISRDGYTLHHLATSSGQWRLPRSEYFKGSRAAFAMAATNETNFLEQLDFFTAGVNGLSPHEVLERMGVPAPSSKLFNDVGLSDSAELDPSKRELLQRFLYAYRWEILKVCRRNRHGLFRNLVELGVADGMRIGFVDVGWSGTTQDMLNRAVKDLFDVEIYGYYLCLRDDKDCLGRRRSMPMQAMISTAAYDECLVRKVYENRVIPELLFSAPHGTIIGYDCLPTGQIVAVEDPGRSSSRNVGVISNEITRGIKAFASRFSDVCQRTDYRPDEYSMLSPLLTFITNLNAEQRSVFSSIENFDTWGSSRNRRTALSEYLIPEQQ
jgi:predicted HAD superfamily hydrolase